MSRRVIVSLAVGAFVLLLLYTTLRSTDTPLDRSPEDRELAQRTCQTAVRGELPDARFPFQASFGDREGEHLRLSGSVDSGPGDQPVRRNYECFLGRDATGGYLADSVVVWQSH